ncbi:A/G-specific adenine glycosylase [Profundibacter sp.]|uniref:A/G-specific adenine glycosylase n=1 Tax=Profundibacter sp. TaxID=3101071 RepID=UPI003D133841
MREMELSDALLGWYDSHARILPWRVPPMESRVGVLPDPYHIWLSEVMLQQTTVAAVVKYFYAFTTRWPTVHDLAAAGDAEVMGEWAGLGYYARARNLLKCARMVVADHGGVFPDTRDALLSLPGIGPYTAAAIAAIAYGHSETVVDGNIERVLARLHDIHTPLPAAKPELTALAATLTPQDRAGDYAQAVMDLGATICTSKSPACGICPWTAACTARTKGTAADLPKRTPKTRKPTRYGIAYIARRDDGAWLLERRPDKGLLGGMLGWPGAEWGAKPVAQPPLEVDWQTLPAEVRHTFTHFHLRLTVQVATVTDEAPDTGHFLPADQFSPDDLPTVMRKAYDLAKDRLIAD